jgi:hypothetical protein
MNPRGGPRYQVASKRVLSMEARRTNWAIWAGFLLSVVAAVSYFLLFARFPITRDVPWVNFLLFGLAAGLLGLGLRRAFANHPVYRGKIAALVLAVASLAILGLFSFAIFFAGKRLPASHDAPHVGQKAPEFLLQDTSGRLVALSELISTPWFSGQIPKGVLLVFYRGYW